MKTFAACRRNDECCETIIVEVTHSKRTIHVWHWPTHVMAFKRELILQNIGSIARFHSDC